MMTTREILLSASTHLQGLVGHEFDVLTISPPGTSAELANLAKIISKLSPIVGNLIEFGTVEYLNAQPDFRDLGKWRRQDPGFPDAVFDGNSGPLIPTPGFEIKAWFPLATEITARFRDSQSHFLDDQTSVCLLAWLPDHVIYGCPRLLGVCVVSAASVARARDEHYYNPPGYLVLEPEDTAERTANLQQTNTNGFRLQELGAEDQARALQYASDLSLFKGGYDVSPDYQSRVRQLFSAFTYRLDTNFAKVDRIQHSEIESFKTLVLGQSLLGHTIGDWQSLFNRRAAYRSDDVYEERLQLLLASAES